MSSSASRLTLYALISAIEEDLRALARTQVLPGIETTAFLTPDEVDKARQRQARDVGSVTPDDTGDELLAYVDFFDLVQALNRHRPALADHTATHLRSITPPLQELVPIRNRVAHSRPVNFSDLPRVSDLATQLVESQPLLWSDLGLTLEHLRREPGFVLGLSIPRTDDAEAHRHNLPTPDFDETGFVGRASVVEQLHSLALGPYPVITIVGEGGAGKTALALKVAYDLLDSDAAPFDAIVWTTAKTAQLTAHEVVRIEGAIQDSLGMLHSVARELSPGTTPGDVLEEVLEYLQNFRLLLVLDNLETVLDTRVRDFLERLPAGSKVLITSRIGIGAFEYPVKLDPLTSGESVELLRALAGTRGVANLVAMPNNKLANYCRRMGNNPGFLKWFVSAVQAGRRPEEVLAKPEVFLDFCMSNVYNYLADESRELLRCMLAVPGRLSQAELAYLSEMSVIDLHRALQQLLTTNMCVMSSTPVGKSFETKYSISELPRNYLARHHNLTQDEARRFRNRRASLERPATDEGAHNGRNDYEVSNLLVRGRSDMALVRYLGDAYRSVSRGRYSEADLLISKARDLAPEYFEVHRAEAWLRANEGNLPSARRAYEVAVELEPAHAPLRRFFGGYLLRLENDPAAALIELEAGLRLDPGSWEIAGDIVRARLELQQFKEAEGVVDALIARHDLPADGERTAHELRLQLLQRRAEARLERGAPNDALDELLKAQEAYRSIPWQLVDSRLQQRSLGRVLGSTKRALGRVGDDRRPDARELVDWLAAEVEGTNVVTSRFKPGDPAVGIVCMIDRAKGFGFIRRQDHVEAFFHKTWLTDEGDWDRLTTGLAVDFVVDEAVEGEERRARAISVTIREGGAG